MKKFLSAVLAAALMLGCTFAVSAEVATTVKDAPTLSATETAVWADDFTAEPGDVVDVTIWYKAVYGFGTFNFGFTYDESKLELVEHYSEDAEENVEIENAGAGWYDVNGKPTKPASWIFPVSMLDNQNNLHATNEYIASLDVPYHYAWGLVDNVRNWGATDEEDKLPFVNVSFKVKEGATGTAIVAPCFYAAAPSYDDGGKRLQYTVVRDDSFNGVITIAGSTPAVPSLTLENTQVLYGHYEEDKTTKYAAAAEFEFDATDVTVEDIKNIGFYYNYVADKTNTPVLESVAIEDVLKADGKFFVTVSDLDLDTEVPLFAYLILSDDTVVMSSMVSITATAANTEPDVTYHPSNYAD